MKPKNQFLNYLNNKYKKQGLAIKLVFLFLLKSFYFIVDKEYFLLYNKLRN